MSPEIRPFLELKTLMLSTLTTEGDPYASYAPYLFLEEIFYVRLSTAALHATHLFHHPKAAILLIEDESKTTDLFARKRLTLQCDATPIAYGEPHWERIQSLFLERFPTEVSAWVMRMRDFHLFALTPLGGRVVLGYGQAHALKGLECVGAVTGLLGTSAHEERE